MTYSGAAVVFSKLILDGGSRLILDGGPMPAARGRRARFGDAWWAAMAQHGWVPAGQSGTFTRPGHRGDRGQPAIAPCPPGILTRSPNRRNCHARLVCRLPECVAGDS